MYIFAAVFMAAIFLDGVEFVWLLPCRVMIIVYSSRWQGFNKTLTVGIYVNCVKMTELVKRL